MIKASSVYHLHLSIYSPELGGRRGGAHTCLHCCVRLHCGWDGLGQVKKATFGVSGPSSILPSGARRRAAALPRGGRCGRKWAADLRGFGEVCVLGGGLDLCPWTPCEQVHIDYCSPSICHQTVSCGHVSPRGSWLKTGQCWGGEDQVTKPVPGAACSSRFTPRPHGLPPGSDAVCSSYRCALAAPPQAMGSSWYPHSSAPTVHGAGR